MKFVACTSKYTSGANQRAALTTNALNKSPDKCSIARRFQTSRCRHHHRLSTTTPHPNLRIKALDAAMPFDFESRAKQRLEEANRLKIGIVGFGKFGQFLAQRMSKAGHTVIATSRGNYNKEAERLGATFFPNSDDFCEEHPDVVILCTSILSLKDVMTSLPIPRLKRNTLFVDVLSVKQFPKSLLLRNLPPEVDILCTHPMFGPDSGKGSWSGLTFMYEKVRIGRSSVREKRVDNFLAFFRDEGCTMVEMTCEEHDVQAASTQFITHTVGRTLGTMGLQPTPIDTKGFQSLLNLVENTANDSFDLYYGLFMYNPNATAELDRLEKAFDAVKKQLFDSLHDKLREQMFDGLDLSSRSNENGSENGNGSNGSSKPSPGKSISSSSV
jgi:arogenate dehydrogenase (NADP+), plant